LFVSVTYVMITALPARAAPVVFAMLASNVEFVTTMLATDPIPPP